MLKRLLTALLLLAGIAFGQTKTPAKTNSVADLYGATVVLYQQDEDTSAFMPICTAWAMAEVKGGYMFSTAAHCLDKEGSYYVSFEENPVVMYPIDDALRGHPEEGFDYALLWVTMGKKIPTLSLGVDPKDVLGEPVIAVSAPLGMGKQTFQGNISNPKVDRAMYMRDEKTHEIRASWTGAILLQMPGINPASSGSALYCVNQKAICGIIVGVIATDFGHEAVALPIGPLVHRMAKTEAAPQP
jgi:hypothetical protein